MNKIFLIITVIIGSIFLSVESKVPQRGDILIYKGAFSAYLPNYLFEHTGIYIGDNYVVEFNGGNKDNGSIAPKIVKTSFTDFKKDSPDNKAYIMNTEKTYPDATKFAPEEVANCAERYLQNQGRNFGHYHPLLNNCQHFVTHCAFGEPLSWQADDIVGVLTLTKKHSSTFNTVIITGEYFLDFMMDVIYLNQ